jgi:hypothetical protein
LGGELERLRFATILSIGSFMVAYGLILDAEYDIVIQRRYRSAVSGKFSVFITYPVCGAGFLLGLIAFFAGPWLFGLIMMAFSASLPLGFWTWLTENQRRRKYKRLNPLVFQMQAVVGIEGLALNSPTGVAFNLWINFHRTRIFDDGILLILSDSNVAYWLLDKSIVEGTPEDARQLVLKYAGKIPVSDEEVFRVLN